MREKIKITSRWLKKASLNELQKVRDLLHKDYMNPTMDMRYRERLIEILHVIDRIISEKKWKGRKVGYPVSTRHGWYLPDDDLN